MSLSLAGQLSPTAGLPGTLPFPVAPEDGARLSRYAEAIAFADGDQWLTRRRKGETRLVANYARALARKVASYVFPAAPSFRVPGETPPGSGGDAGGRGGSNAAQTAERWLAETVRALDLPTLDLALCIDQAIAGDAALKVTWNPATNAPRVVAVDPATLFALWSPDDPRTPSRFAQVYQLPGHAIPTTWANQVAGVTPAGYYPVIEDWTADRWAVSLAGQTVVDQPNPYGWLPYVVAPNDARATQFWGRSDLTDLYDVCRELNTRLSTLSRILELSGTPIAVLENVDGSEGIRVGPGAKWELPEGAKAYLLDLLSGGGVGLHVTAVDLFYRALHDLAETPRTAFGDSGRQLSGAALEVEIQPLVQKVRRKRRAWDAVYHQRNARLLSLAARFANGPNLGPLPTTETVWPEILPSDQEADVRMAAQLVANGLQAHTTASARFGADDPIAEFDRVLAETRALAAANGGGDGCTAIGDRGTSNA